MSDEKQPELTPAEQQKQDEGRVKTQLVVTDATELGKEVLSLFMPGSVPRAGRTSFEGHELNAIIDLVENSNPADLENAGEALWKARDAIRSAAKELGDHIDGVDWQGDSGEAFRKWGKGLYDLEHYRDTVRGFCLDFETRAPGPLLVTTDEVAQALRSIGALAARHADAYESFRRDYCDLDDGRAAARVADRLLADAL
ncbi:hypothetical protein SMICM304S_03224 [Streptomyces microflavus]